MTPQLAGAPVVTLTTDFGTADGYVGAMKGVILSLAPDAVVVDITHDVAAYDIAGGAFALAQAAPFFPPGTIHVAVVDPGVGGAREALVVEAAGARFVGPDNGVLSLAARGPRVAHRIATAPFRRDSVSPTFHGRDVFASCAGRLAAGGAVHDAGPLVDAMADLGAPAAGPGKGSVLHVDRFGNVVTSFGGDILGSLPAADGAAPTIVIVDVSAGRRFVLPVRRTYADVARGSLVAYVGSAGLVEVAVREGSAVTHTGLKRGSSLRIEESS